MGREAIIPGLIALLAYISLITCGAGGCKNGEKNDMKTRLNDARGNNQLRARYEGLPQAMNQKSKELKHSLKLWKKVLRSDWKPRHGSEKRIAETGTNETADYQFEMKSCQSISLYIQQKGQFCVF